MKESNELRRGRRGVKAAVEERDGITMIRLGSANIWDGGDLGRLREAAKRVFNRDRKKIGIDLSHVGLLPSGFMNMLCGWEERGIEVYLFAPRPNVREMYWFRRFAEFVGSDVWKMACESAPKCEPPVDGEPMNYDRPPSARSEGLSYNYVVHAGMNVESPVSRPAGRVVAGGRQFDHA